MRRALASADAASSVTGARPAAYAGVQRLLRGGNLGLRGLFALALLGLALACRVRDDEG